jgi:muramoyltetrapeptide carboxypeptidase
MIRPSYLRKGDSIGITAPAGCLMEKEIEPAVEIIKSWGLKVEYGRYLFRKRHSFAGTDNQRASDLQEMMDNPEIKAIICARGGYGTVRIISRLKFNTFIKNPKWVVGYSDITVLHSALHNLGFESIHGAMPRVVAPKKPDMVSFESLRSLLFGEVKKYLLPAHTFNIPGKAEGELVGGNLSVLHSLAGTPYDIDTRGKILFIEDIGEYLYHFDRMMMNLKLSGKLRGLAGLIAGDMTDMKSSSSGFKKPAYQIIREAVSEYNYPVMFGFPGGHGDVNLAVPFGKKAAIGVGEQKVELTW